MPRLLDDVERAGERVRQAREELDAAREELAEAIVRAAGEGVPVARIARAAGLSRERARQIGEERSR